MTTAVCRIPYRSLDLPWTPIPEDRERFRRLLRDIAIGVLLFGLIMPWLPVPELDVNEIPEVPQRYARLMLDKPKPPPPPPVLEEPEAPAEVTEEVKPVEQPVEPEQVAPTPEPARERAAKAGLMAFADSLADLRDNDAVIPVTPAVDTLVREDGGMLDALLDRVHISAVQTPQAFRTDLIVRAHREAEAKGFSSSDEGSLVFALGETVRTIPGERTNIKITFEDDVPIAEAILGRAR